MNFNNGRYKVRKHNNWPTKAIWMFIFWSNLGPTEINIK